MDPFNFLFGVYEKEIVEAAKEEVKTKEKAKEKEAAGTKEVEKKASRTLLGNGLSLRPYKNAILVTGSKRLLIPYTDMFAQMGGNWNASLKGWVFAKRKETELRKCYPLLDIQTKKRVRFTKARRRAVARRNKKTGDDSFSDTSMEYSDEEEEGSSASGTDETDSSANSEVTEISFMVDNDLRPVGFRVPQHKLVAFIYNQIRLGDLREVTLRQLYKQIAMEFKEERLSKADKAYIKEILERCLEVAY